MKKEKEFNLSEKIIWDDEIPIDRMDLSVKHVKEFIKRCFEDMEKKVILNKIKYGDVVRIIKKRAERS